VRDKHGEFLKGRPSVFTHAAYPLEADDWVRAVEKQLNTHLVSYKGQPILGGNLISPHIPTMLLLSPGKSLSETSRHDKFAQLSRYAPNEVREDADKQRLFLKGIYYDLRLQLAGNTYPNFQALVNRAIMLDNMRKEMDRKRRMQG
jgi:hypothetical protein